jgi:hypothetical protein
MPNPIAMCGNMNEWDELAAQKMTRRSGIDLIKE